MSLKQWVNLTKTEVFKDKSITSLDRCEKVSVDITLENTSEALGYKLRVELLDKTDAVYTPDEESRNENFRLQKGKIGVIDEKTIRVSDIKLPAAGGCKYKIEVLDANENVVSSDTEIEVWRRLYYQVISMKGVVIPTKLDSFEADFKNEKEKFCLELIEKDDARDKMKFIRTVSSIYTGVAPYYTDSLNGELFRDEARKVYTLNSYHPYSVAVVFSNYIGTKQELPLRIAIDRTIESPDYKIGPNQVNVRVADINGDEKFLWHNLDRDDSQTDNKDWLIPNSVKFITDDDREISIPDTDIKITGTKEKAEGGYKYINIKFRTAELQAEFAGLSGMLELDLYFARGFSGGFSYNGLNLITVATKAWWTPSVETKMLQILNHEMGHKIGMVAYGDKGDAPEHKNNNDFYPNKLLPDAPSTLYGENRGVNDYGHAGPHCKIGASYNTTTKIWSGTPGCVMFGATGLSDPVSGSYKVTPKEFCPECAKIVRKLDLDGNRLQGLKEKF